MKKLTGDHVATAKAIAAELGILQGPERAIPHNLRKAIATLVTTASGNLSVIVGALLLGLPLPFIPV